MLGKVLVRSLSKVTTRLTPCGVSGVEVSGPGRVLEWGLSALDSRAAVWTSCDESGAPTVSFHHCCEALKLC